MSALRLGASCTAVDEGVFRTARVGRADFRPSKRRQTVLTPSRQTPPFTGHVAESDLLGPGGNFDHTADGGAAGPATGSGRIENARSQDMMETIFPLRLSACLKRFRIPGQR